MEAALADSRVCGVLLELIQGEGGLRVLKRTMYKKWRLSPRERISLLLIDEVQTGNGRTGEHYCYMNYGIQPDLVSTAKGLAAAACRWEQLFLAPRQRMC